jgi:hypothetical protein
MLAFPKRLNVMKLVPVTIQYSCGTIINDRVSLDPATREVHFSSRLTVIFLEMAKTEDAPMISINLNGRNLPVVHGSDGELTLGSESDRMRVGALRSIFQPNRRQRHANGHLAYLLSIASFAGACWSASSVTTWNLTAAADVASLLVCATLLGIVGLYCKMD